MAHEALVEGAAVDARSFEPSLHHDMGPSTRTCAEVDAAFATLWVEVKDFDSLKEFFKRARWRGLVIGDIDVSCSMGADV